MENKSRINTSRQEKPPQEKHHLHAVLFKSQNLSTTSGASQARAPRGCVVSRWKIFIIIYPQTWSSHAVTLRNKSDANCTVSKKQKKTTTVLSVLYSPTENAKLASQTQTFSIRAWHVVDDIQFRLKLTPLDLILTYKITIFIWNLEAFWQQHQLDRLWYPKFQFVTYILYQRSFPFF